jgi:hypothetical protein
MVKQLFWSALTLAAAGTAFMALIGQCLALATFVGWFPASDAGSLTGWYSIPCILWFAILLLNQMQRDGWQQRKTQQEIRLEVAVREHPIRTLSGIYWLVALIGLAVLGGLDNRGLTVQGGHYYLIHVRHVLMPISYTEYQHQASYPLWMFSATTLFIATLALSPALSRSLWASDRSVRLLFRHL